MRTLSASDISTGTAVGTVGIMVGCMVAPFINERFGRKVSFMCLATVGIVGSIVMACTSITRTYWAFVSGKIIVNISVGMASAVTGVYQSECSPRRIRGALTNAYTVFNNFGTLLANIIMLLVHKRMDSGVWLVPIAVQFVFPVIIIVATPFLPESPRWLLAKGRTDAARAQLKRLRGRKATDASINEEMTEMEDGIAYERSLHNVSWLSLFKGHELMRTLIATGMLCLQQGQGISFTNNYLNITMLNLGFTNTYELLVAVYTGKWFITLFGFYLPDRLGRRPMAITGACIMGACMFTMAIVATVTHDHPTGALGKLTLAAIFIWVFSFAPTWGALPWTTAAEISSQHLRAKTLAVAAWGGYAVGLINNFVVPYIQSAQYGNLGGRITYIFGGFSVVSVVLCWLFLPELKGRSLEDIELLFESGTPLRKFKSTDVEALRAGRAPVETMGDEKASVYEDGVKV